MRERPDPIEKNDRGPEHSAPHNPNYAGSFDEFAGVFKREGTEFLAHRGADYTPESLPPGLDETPDEPS